MAAYTCVISLLQTLEQIQQRNPYFAKLFDSLHASAQYFQLVLDETSCKTGSRFDTQKIKSLEEKIRVAASDAEDAVALEISQILQGVNLRYAVEHSTVLHSRLLPIVERMDALTKHVMKMVSDFDTIRISTSGGDGDGDDGDDEDEILEFGDTLISTSNSPMLNLEDDTVQGLDDDLKVIVERLTGPVSHLDIVTITGMGGIGKTTLARKAHDHLAVRHIKELQ